MADRRTKVILGIDTGPYVRGLAKASTATHAFVKDLDSSDSRMGNLVQTSLALGPALVPIAAAGVPAVAALTAGLGAAAGAVSVLALALNGIGDGLGALNDYQLEPSAENLAKVREEFEKLGPAGAHFVLYLDKLEPQLRKLQNTAREGLLPGVEEGIDSLLERGPQARRIIAEISGALGDAAAESGKELASDDWNDFFDYLETEARPILGDLLRTAGNVATGLAHMIPAVDPLTQDFSKGMLEASRDFEKWADGIEKTQGFQDFIDYVQRVSPKAVDTLGAIAKAGLDIVEAAAPIGEVTLPVLKALAETLSAIANSPAGPALIAAAAGLSAVSRGVALYNAANGSALLGLLSKGGKEGKKAGLGFRGAAAGVGVLALSLTDIDDKLGVSNTAMGVAIGTLAGPWGAAIGGAIGGAIDFAHRNDDVADSLKAVDRAAANPGNLHAYEKAVTAAVEKTQDALDKATNIDKFGDFTSPTEAFRYGVESLTHDLRDAAEEAQQGQLKFADLRQTLGEIRSYTLDREGGFDNLSFDIGTLTKFAARAKPALHQMGYSLKDLRKVKTEEEMRRIAAGIRNFNREVDSVPGRTKGARNAIKGLDNPLLNTADSAEILDAKLTNLFDPSLNAEQSMIDWKLGLKDLRKQIAKTSGALDDQSREGLTNRSSIIQQITSLKSFAQAQAENGASARKVAKILRDGRKALIDTGEAAGISRPKIRNYVDSLVDIPRTVKTILDTPGAKKSQNDVDTLARKIANVPNKLNIFTDAPGAPKSTKDIEGLDGWVHTIQSHDKVDIKTDAPGAPKAKDEIDDLDKSVRGTPDKKDVKTDAPGARKAKGDFDDLNSAIRNLQGKTVDVKLSTNATKIVQGAKDLFGSIGDTLGFADGGTVDYYANGDVRNGHTAQIAPAGAWRVWAEDETGGEAYIPLAPSKRGRSLDIWQETGRRLGVEGFADGGVRVSTKDKDPLKPLARIDKMYDRIADAIGVGLGKVYSKAIESVNIGGGFHWPLPRQYGYTGHWGSYESGGSHPALDFPAPTGTPIYAVLPGKVQQTTSLGDTSYGNYTITNHGHGISSLVAHQSAFKTHPGAVVSAGETIGLVGAVGNTTGPHEHLELRKNGVSFDYTSWLKGGGPAWIQGGTGLPDKYNLTGSGVSRYTPVVKDVLRALGQPAGPNLTNAVLARMQQESGGNPGIVNTTDINWQNGTPSVGLMQVIGPTYQANKPHPDRGPYKYGTSIDPYSNIYAGLHYAEGRYPSIYYAMTKPGGYADGGIRNGAGIDVFDQGGVWRSGRLGINLSGRDEYVNDPQATAAAIHMANGGLIGPMSSGSSGHSGHRNRIHRESTGDDITIRIPPGGIRSFKDLLEMVSKPAAAHNIRDLNDAWRDMRDETAKLNREERQLQRMRDRSKSSAKAVRESEKKLEDLRAERDKSTEKRQRIEEKLKDVRREGGDELKELDKAEKALIKVRRDALKNGKISKSEQKEITQAEDELRRKRQHASDATRKANKIEAKLLKARRDETVDDRQVHRLRERLHNQREREKITAKDLAKQEKDVTDQRDKLNKATEKWKNLQKELIAQAREVADAITAQGDVFGGAGTSNTAQGLLKKLQGARGDAKDFGRLIKRLRGRGVNQEILDQILDQGSTPEALNLLQSLAHAPNSLIHKINEQQKRLDKLANQVGTWSITPEHARPRHHRGGGSTHGHAGRGRVINNNFNGPIYTRDPKDTAREIERRQRKGLLVAGGA